MGPVKQALADTQLKPTEIDEVVLVGGTTRTPLIRVTVENIFDRKPHTELNPDEVVALGAAVQANILDRGVTKYAAARRHPAIAGDRNLRRSGRQSHSAQLHDSRQRAGDVHHRRRQPDRHRHSCPTRGTRTGARIAVRWRDSIESAAGSRRLCRASK